MPSPLAKRFELESLPDVDGGVISETFNRELTRLVKDCDDRPMDDKPRVLTLTIKLTPEPDTNGSTPCCDRVSVEVEVAGKVPIQRTRPYVMKPRQDGSLIFHPDISDDPEAEGIFDRHDAKRNKGE